MKRPYFYVDDDNSADSNPPSNKRMKLGEGGNTKEDFHYNSFEEIASGKKQWKSNIEKKEQKKIFSSAPLLKATDADIKSEKLSRDASVYIDDVTDKSSTTDAEEEENDGEESDDKSNEKQVDRSDEDVEDLVSEFTNKDNTVFLYKLSNNRYVKGCMFKSKIFIHIRDYVVADKTLYSSKNGIALNIHQFNELLKVNTSIDELVNQCVHDDYVNTKFHLGNNKHVSVSSEFEKVDLRSFWLPYNTSKLKATKRGIALTFPEWERWGRITSKLTINHPTLFEYIPCYLKEDHVLNDGANRCAECNPNHWKDEAPNENQKKKKAFAKPL